MKKFLQELQRRNVIKAAISYAVISWAILQASDILFPAFEISDTTIQYVLYVLIGLFPIWIIFAYIFEWTPTGFKKTDEVAQETSIHQQTGKRLNQFIIGGLILAVLLLVTDRVFNFTGASDTAVSDKSIAVLPFVNLSDEEDAYFATGVTEDILTQISKIGDLRVLSRFTLRDYDTSGKTIQQIGKELGVGYLLMGSIRKINDELRISCQLVQVFPEEETWAENFDRRMDDIFKIQQQVSMEVAKYLKVALTPLDQSEIGKVPTENIAAYNLYLKGRENYNKYTKESVLLAIELYKEAIDLDPGFSLAYAGLADAYVYGTQIDLSLFEKTYLDTALINAERAIALDPNSADAWKAMGFANANKGFDDVASEMYEKAIEINPNHHPAIHNLAVQKVKENKLAEAKVLLEKSISLSPLSFHDHNSLAATYFKMDSLDLADQYWRKAYDLNPDYIHTLTNLIILENKRGNYEESVVLAKRRLRKDTMNWQSQGILAETYLNLDSLDLAEKHLKKAYALNPTAASTISNAIKLYLKQTKYIEALELAYLSYESDASNLTYLHVIGEIYYRLEMFKESEEILLKTLQKDPKSITTHLHLANLYIYARQKEKGKKYVYDVVKLDPPNPVLKPRLLEIALDMSLNLDIEMGKEFTKELVSNRDFNPKEHFSANTSIAYILWQEGKQDSANVWIDQAENYLSEERDKQKVSYYKACICAIKGDKKGSLRHLKKAIDLGFTGRDNLFTDLRFELMHKDPQFLDMMQEIETRLSKMRVNARSIYDKNLQQTY